MRLGHRGPPMPLALLPLLPLFLINREAGRTTNRRARGFHLYNPEGTRILISPGRHHIVCDGPPPTLTNRAGTTPLAWTSRNPACTPRPAGWNRRGVANPGHVSAHPHPKKMQGLDVRCCTHLAAYQTTGCQVGVPCPTTWGMHEMHFIWVGPDKDVGRFQCPCSGH